MTIACRALTVERGRRRALSAVDVEFAPGGLIGVIGPNGAGKSTLACALLNLLPPTSGSIAIDGVAACRLPPAELARRVAYLPQSQELHWPLSVERLVALGRLPHLGPYSRLGPADDAAVEAAMRDAGVLDLRHRIATELSGGERARAFIARALATQAPALIADEPLAALDPAHQIDVMALLAERARAGALVIVILHDLAAAARHCHRLVLLHDGRVVGDGPPDQVLTDDALAIVYGIEAFRGRTVDGPLVVPARRLRR